MTTTDRTAGLREDRWLSGVIGRPVFVVDEACPAGDVRGLAGVPGPAMFTARVPVHDTVRLGALTDAGFRVVECAITLTRPATPVEDDPSVHLAGPADADALAAIAGDAFRWTRFHLDPELPLEAAAAVKREWARNCATGARGIATLVTRGPGGDPTGFLAVLQADDGARVIDLIAVAPGHQGRGVGRALVTAFIARFGAGATVLRVGTQAANVGSLRLYEACGFRVHSAAVTLHLHA